MVEVEEPAPATDEPLVKALINGASRGIGTFAVQIAKSYGSEVSGVTNTRNVDLVDSLGTDHVGPLLTELHMKCSFEVYTV
jgi:NADPH:quinone reductase-like Zn-dependent oxidoreductase